VSDGTLTWKTPSGSLVTSLMATTGPIEDPSGSMDGCWPQVPADRGGFLVADGEVVASVDSRLAEPSLQRGLASRGCGSVPVRQVVEVGAGERDARSDAELGEDVPKVGVHRVAREVGALS
jgi:hypothetical protein